MLTFPGASYLIGLDHIAGKDASTAATVTMPRLQRGHAMLPTAHFLLHLRAVEDTRCGEPVQGLVQQQLQSARLRLAGGIGILLIVKGVIELL